MNVYAFRQMIGPAEARRAPRQSAEWPRNRDNIITSATLTSGCFLQSGITGLPKLVVGLKMQLHSLFTPMNNPPKRILPTVATARPALGIVKSARVALWLLVLIPIVSSTVRAEAVTNIKEIVNNTRGDLEIRKLDITFGAAGGHTQFTGRIPANGGIWSGDMWIPWAANSDEHLEKRIEVLVKKGGRPPVVIFTIWQQGDRVRFHNVRQNFVENAPLVTGQATAGGERRMVFFNDGPRIAFRLENFR